MLLELILSTMTWPLDQPDILNAWELWSRYEVRISSLKNILPLSKGYISFKPCQAICTLPLLWYSKTLSITCAILLTMFYQVSPFVCNGFPTVHHFGDNSFFFIFIFTLILKCIHKRTVVYICIQTTNTWHHFEETYIHMLSSEMLREKVLFINKES